MFKKEFNYKNKLVLITGGTSGIGLSLLNILKTKKCKIAVIGRNKEIIRKIRKYPNTNYSIKVYEFDLNKIEKIRFLINKIEEDFNTNISVFISCATISAFSFLEDLPEKNLKEIYFVNTLAPYIITKYLIPNMKRNNIGQLIFLTSGAGFRGLPFNSAYCGSKFSLNGWIESLRVEIFNFNIDLISISPGPTKTNNYIRTKKFGKITKPKNKNLSNPDEVSKKIFNTMKKGKNICVYFALETFPGI